MSIIEQVITELEKIASQAVIQPATANTLSMAEVKAQVLGAYATYKAQEATVVKLSESLEVNIKMQSATIRELREQAKWTKWLAIATTILATSTVVLSLITYLK